MGASKFDAPAKCERCLMINMWVVTPKFSLLPSAPICYTSNMSPNVLHDAQNFVITDSNINVADSVNVTAAF